MKLALDNHYSPAIAETLRSGGHDAIAIIEPGWDTQTDEALLDLCANERRALVTNNVADFAVITRQWAGQGRSHWGLVFTSDRSMPRNRGGIGRLARALGQLLAANPRSDDFKDQIQWL